MNKKITNILSTILPNKKENLLVLFLLVLGVISGSIFLVVISKTDKALVQNQITNFITNLSNNKIDNVQAFKNSITQNTIYIGAIWLFGMSIIGIIINLFLIYFRGFTIGFSLGSLFLTYKYKGLLAGLIYLFPTYIINILIIVIIGSYSAYFTKLLWKQIFVKDINRNFRHNLKKYFLILGITIVLALISSLSEAYLIPAFLKLIIKLFI